MTMNGWLQSLFVLLGFVPFLRFKPKRRVLVTKRMAKSHHQPLDGVFVTVEGISVGLTNELGLTRHFRCSAGPKGILLHINPENGKKAISRRVEVAPEARIIEVKLKYRSRKGRLRAFVDQ